MQHNSLILTHPGRSTLPLIHPRKSFAGARAEGWGGAATLRKNCCTTRDDSIKLLQGLNRAIAKIVWGWMKFFLEQVLVKV